DDPANDIYYTDDPRFWEIAAWLNTVRVVDPHASPWVYVRENATVNPYDFYYVIDGLALTEPLSPDTVNFKERDEEVEGNLFAGLEGTAVFLDDAYEWRGKWWVSGFTPITNAQGEVVAGLGIDYEAEYIREVEREVRSLAIPAFLVTYAGMFVLIYLSSRALSRPIVKLTAIAGAIAEGNYDQDFTKVRPSGFADEIDTLANVFQLMIGKVAQREEKLKQQVAALEIQINHSQRDEQVKEIVGNEFFQSLQTKASELRARRSQEESLEAPEDDSTTKV
ncbi:MAG: HAMP domain-containing protein, partial [Chloroflexota bacterium]